MIQSVAADSQLTLHDWIQNPKNITISERNRHMDSLLPTLIYTRTDAVEIKSTVTLKVFGQTIVKIFHVTGSFIFIHSSKFNTCEITHILTFLVTTAMTS